jgi:hypothetical protein
MLQRNQSWQELAVTMGEESMPITRYGKVYAMRSNGEVKRENSRSNDCGMKSRQPEGMAIQCLSDMVRYRGFLVYGGRAQARIREHAAMIRGRIVHATHNMPKPFGAQRAHGEVRSVNGGRYAHTRTHVKQPAADRRTDRHTGRRTNGQRDVPSCQQQ